MKKRVSIFMTIAGFVILLGGLLTYGLGIHELAPVPRPDLIVTGTSLIGILLIISGAFDLLAGRSREMEIEEKDMGSDPVPDHITGARSFPCAPLLLYSVLFFDQCTVDRTCRTCQSKSLSYVVSRASRIALSCWTCMCWIPLSILTRHSLVIGIPCRFIIRTSSTCPIPLDFLIFLILCPISPAASCLIFCSVLSHPLN